MPYVRNSVAGSEADVAVDRLRALHGIRFLPVDVIGSAEVSSTEWRHDHSAAAGANIRPREDRAAIGVDIVKLERSRLQGPGQRVVDRTHAGSVEHAEAAAHDGLIVREWPEC